MIKIHDALGAARSREKTAREAVGTASEKIAEAKRMANLAFDGGIQVAAAQTAIDDAARQIKTAQTALYTAKTNVDAVATAIEEAEQRIPDLEEIIKQHEDEQSDAESIPNPGRFAPKRQKEKFKQIKEEIERRKKFISESKNFVQQLRESLDTAPGEMSSLNWDIRGEEAKLQAACTVLQQLMSSVKNEAARVEAVNEAARIKAANEVEAARVRAANEAETARVRAVNKAARVKAVNEAGKHFPSVVATLIERSAAETARDAATKPANRVVTIYGPSGTGKTQLALNVLQELVPGVSDQRIDEERVAFIDCAQIGFDDVFVRCLQRLSKGEEVWNEIEDSYKVLNSNPHSDGLSEGKIREWFPAGLKTRYLLLDNCDCLFEVSSDIKTAFLSALGVILGSDNTSLRLLLTLKRESNVAKIVGHAPKLTMVELDVNLSEQETRNYLRNCEIKPTALDDRIIDELRSRNCATPLIVALVCDVWSERENWQSNFFKELDEKAPIHEVPPEKAGEEDEKRRSNAVAILVKKRLNNLSEPAQMLMASLAVLAFYETGNQVAFFAKQTILKVGSRAFSVPLENLAGAFAGLDTKICDLRNDQKERAFRHETLQKAVYDFYVARDKGEFKKYRSSLHSEAGKAFEDLVVHPASNERIKWAVSAAYQWIEAGDSETIGDRKAHYFKTAENIIDAVDSSMRMQFFYLDYERVRVYLKEKLEPGEEITETHPEVFLENAADLGEIYYQGLDDWDKSELMACAAKGSEELPLSGVIPQSQLQARHLWKILIYEKQIPEKVEPGAMTKLLSIESIDKSIKANVYSTDGMHRTRSEEYGEAVKSYAKAIALAEEHCQEMRDTVNSNRLSGELTRFLEERLDLWAALDIARYHSNKAATAAFTIGPQNAARDLKKALEAITAGRKSKFSNHPEVLIPSRQEFQYVTLNHICLYLAAGNVDAADEAFDQCGKLPSEVWLNNTIDMMRGIRLTYRNVFDDADRQLEKTEKDFALLDPRNAAFARFNRVAARINCLLCKQYDGDEQKEANRILLELSNIRARPFWFGTEFENISGFVQELRAPNLHKDFSSLIKQKLLALCDESRDITEAGQVAQLRQVLTPGQDLPESAASDLRWGINRLLGKEELLGEKPLISPANAAFRRELLDLAGTEPKLLEVCGSYGVTGKLLEETKMRCCHDLLHGVYKAFIRQKDSTDWLHEYPFAAKVVTYTSEKFAEQHIQFDKSLVSFDENLVLADDNSGWTDWRDFIKKYYHGLMFPNGGNGQWRAPFLMPRIVLMRSKPMLPSAEDVGAMCEWLQGIEDRRNGTHGT